MPTDKPTGHQRLGPDVLNPRRSRYLIEDTAWMPPDCPPVAAEELAEPRRPVDRTATAIVLAVMLAVLGTCLHKAGYF